MTVAGLWVEVVCQDCPAKGCALGTPVLTMPQHAVVWGYQEAVVESQNYGVMESWD